MSTIQPSLQQQVQSLYSDHHGWLVGWLRKKLSCPHGAADVAQDTFLRIITSRDALFGMREPRAYLSTTAKRLLLDRARRQMLERTYLAELALLADSLPGAPSPDEVIMAVQALEQIATALGGLSAKARDAFLLHYLEELPQAAVAAQLNVSTRMVQKYLVQALLACRHACPGMAA
nr:sigma-70 family RNA polymerase sigma factor [uncultured Janthinobacterium sp.]